MPDYEPFMRRALALARRGEGRVEPNPMVGAVIVRGNRVVAEGWHDAFGGPHAEAAALRAAGNGRTVRGATMVVTLEPCAHTGKTPPCAPALVASGIRRVVIAGRDPNPVTRGRGVATLRRGGVEVVEGLLREEAEILNAPFYAYHREHRPWVIAKWAMSADGRIATRAGESKWITGPEARAFARRIRARCQAVAVGIGTALRDDPELLPAAPPEPPPCPRPFARVILDSRARLPLASRLVRTVHEVPVIVAVSSRAPRSRCRALEGAGCEILAAGRHRVEIPRLLEALGRRGLAQVLVEGGGEVLGSLFDARVADEVFAFVAPRVIGGTEAPAPVGGTGPAAMNETYSLDRPEWIPAGTDFVLHGFPRRG